MLKAGIAVTLLLLTSCSSIPIEALSQSFNTIGPEYIDYVVNDPRYNENEEGISDSEKQLRKERKQIRLLNIRKTQELLNELSK